MHKSPFVGRFQGIAPGQGAFDIDGDITINGALRCFDRMVAVNKEHDGTIFQFGFKQGANYVLYGGGEEEKGTVPIVSFGKVWLPGDWRPFVRVTLATPGDVIEFFTFGYTTAAVE